MGNPLPDENFEQSVTRLPTRGPSPDPARPDWLTRANDHSAGGSASAGPGARPAPAAYPPHPTAPGGVPKLERDTILSAHVPNRAPAPGAEPGAWEGAVKQVARAARSADTPPGAGSRGPRRAPARGDSGLQAALGLFSKPLVRLLLVVAALAVVAMALRPKGVDDTTSISAIRHHPERFDGQAVKIRGKVGEVFIVGGGYAFYLHQGRDTMVVFTRSRVPVRSEHVTIAGSISNGVLDGKPRQALFEATH